MDHGQSRVLVLDRSLTTRSALAGETYRWSASPGLLVVTSGAKEALWRIADGKPIERDIPLPSGSDRQLIGSGKGGIYAARADHIIWRVDEGETQFFLICVHAERMCERTGPIRCSLPDALLVLPDWTAGWTFQYRCAGTQPGLIVVHQRAGSSDESIASTDEAAPVISGMIEGTYYLTRPAGDAHVQVIHLTPGPAGEARTVYPALAALLLRDPMSFLAASVRDVSVTPNTLAVSGTGDQLVRTSSDERQASLCLVGPGNAQPRVCSPVEFGGDALTRVAVADDQASILELPFSQPPRGLLLRIHGGPFEFQTTANDSLDNLALRSGVAVLKVNYIGNDRSYASFSVPGPASSAQELASSIDGQTKEALSALSLKPDQLVVEGESFGGLLAPLVARDLGAGKVVLLSPMLGCAAQIETLQRYDGEAAQRWSAFAGYLRHLDGETCDPQAFFSRSPATVLTIVSATDPVLGPSGVSVVASLMGSGPPERRQQVSIRDPFHIHGSMALDQQNAERVRSFADW